MGEDMNNKEKNDAVNNLLLSMPGGVIRFEVSDDSKITLISDKVLEILGCNKEDIEMHYKNNVSNMVHPEDKNIVKQNITAAFNSSKSCDIKFRIIDINGVAKWVTAATYISEMTSNIIKGYAIINDITEYMKAEEILEQQKVQLEKEKENYKRILNENSDLYFELNVNEDTMMIYNINRSFDEVNSSITEFRSRLVKSKKIHEDDKDKILKLINLESSAELEFRYISVDGSVIWCALKVVASNNHITNEKIIMGWINNIDVEKREMFYQLEKNNLDPLTKLYNQAYVEQNIDEYLTTEGKDGCHIMLIVDIDNFTLIDEKLGSIFGDAVLLNISESLTKVFSDKDIIARVGGDEFVVFIKNIDDIGSIIEKVEEVRASLYKTYAGENLEKPISCSIGIASYPNNGYDYKSLFKATDSALYYAKITGRDRYQFFDTMDMEKIQSGAKELFNNYNFDSIKRSGFSSFNREITSFAFDIMMKTKDVNSAINIILEKIGKQFDATYVNIVELIGKKAEMTYRWSKQSGNAVGRKMLFKAEDAFITNYKKNFDQQGIFAIDDTGKQESSFALKWLFDKDNVKSFLSCEVTDDSSLEGCVNIVDCEKTREWTKNEIDSLTTITRVISSYLLKMRTTQKMEERLNEVKNFDSVTGLPTYYKFKNDAKEYLADNQRKKFVIINLDIYRFKSINDTYGYKVGDGILRDLGQQMIAEGSKILIACRVASDNFMALLEYKNEQEIIDYVKNSSLEFEKMEQQKNPNYKIKICAGACVVDSNLGDVMIPIDNANIARKHAKENLIETCYFFNDEMKRKLQIEFEITNTMEKALAYHEFKVYLQPKVSLSDGKLAGAEALVRWVRPDKSIMPPDKFIPLFEKNGFVVNLDFFVYEQVCIMIREWMEKDWNVVPISVNVSRVHLYDSHFVDDFCRLIDRYQIPNELVELELTESIFLDNTEVAINTMHRFRNMGFKVSIDDFGAGYSSLNLLKEMTSDVLKIDKGFFGNAELQREEQIILSSIVNMAKQLNMKVLSEGVETNSQSEFLKNIECDLAQGYLFAKPMPKEDFENLMENNMQFKV
ncbi:MAG: EAL domain-containing protein [Lachnospiraceae bacterium]|nr:EAL domain-containing protein [Lachnospiraceae bacterium]